MALDLDRIAKIPTPQKLAVLGFLVIGMYVAFWFLYVTPQNDIISKAEKELQEIQTKILKLQNVEERKEEYTRKRKVLEAKLKEAQRKLPDKAEIPELLQRIDNLGRGTRLSFKKFKPGAEVIKSLYAEVPIDVTIEGTYHQVATFFDRLAKLERIINVTSITMSPVGGQILKVDCKIKTYRLVEESKAPAKGKKGANAKKGKGRK